MKKEFLKEFGLLIYDLILQCLMSDVNFITAAGTR